MYGSSLTRVYQVVLVKNTVNYLHQSKLEKSEGSPIISCVILQ